MRQLISLGLIVTGALAVLKVVGLVAVLITGHPHAHSLLVKQALFAAGFASLFIRLHLRQKQDEQERREAVKAKRARRRGTTG